MRRLAGPSQFLIVAPGVGGSGASRADSVRGMPIAEGMAMGDDEVFDVQRREELRLIKTFLIIKDPAKRQRVLKLAEQLADHAASEISGPAGPSYEEASRDAHRPE